MPVLCAFVLVGAGAIPAHAQTWVSTTDKVGEAWSDGTKWSGGVAPANNGTANVVFSQSNSTNVAELDADWNVASVFFNSTPGLGQGIQHRDQPGDSVQLCLQPSPDPGSGGGTITIFDGETSFNGLIGGTGTLTLTPNRPVAATTGYAAINTNGGVLTLNSVVSGSSSSVSLTKNGVGTLILTNAGNTAAMSVIAGTLQVEHLNRSSKNAAGHYQLHETPP